MHLGKRIQCFTKFAPIVCSFYTLGWVRLERFVEVKKMLFIRSILCLKDNTCVKRIFCERATFFNNPGAAQENRYISAVLNILQTSITFGLNEYIRNFIQDGCNVSQVKWQEIVWNRAWELENLYWSIQSKAHKSLEVLNKLCYTPRYLVWWQN